MTEGDQAYVIEGLHRFGPEGPVTRKIEGVTEHMHLAEKWVEKASKAAGQSGSYPFVTYKITPVLVIG